MTETTACRRCGRAIYVTDVDDKGRCVYCQPAEKPDSKPDKPKPKATEGE